MFRAAAGSGALNQEIEHELKKEMGNGNFFLDRNGINRWFARKIFPARQAQQELHLLLSISLYCSGNI